MNRRSSKMKLTKTTNPKKSNKVAHIFIFSGISLVGQEYFDKERIAIGSGPAADLTLPGKGVADLQALIYFRNGNVIISDHTPLGGVLVNGKAEKTALLSPYDLVDIGPYTLKIKMESGAEGEKKAIEQRAQSAKKEASYNYSPKGIASHGKGHAPQSLGSAPRQAKIAAGSPQKNPEKKASQPAADIQKEFDSFIRKFSHSERKRYNLVFKSQFRPGIDPEQAKRDLAGLFRFDLHQIERMLGRSQVVIKEGIDHATGLRMKATLDRIGAVSLLEPVGSSPKGKAFPKKTLPEKFVPKSRQAEVPPKCQETGDSLSDDDGEIIDLLAIEDGSQDRHKGFLEKGSPVQDAAKPEPTMQTVPYPVPEVDIETAKEALLDDIANRGELSPVAGIDQADEAGKQVIDELRDEKCHLEDNKAVDKSDPKQPLDLKSTPIVEDYDDEEDDDDCEASFLLRDKFIQYEPAEESRNISAQQSDIFLEVLKYQGDTVIDARFLKPRGKYFIQGDKRRFCLTEFKKSRQCFFYFDNNLTGIINTGGSDAIPTEQLKQRDKPWRKRKGIYRDFVPNSGNVLLDDGTYRYLLRKVPKRPKMEIKEDPKGQTRNYKHIVTSFLFHAFFVAFLGLWPTFNAERHKIDEPRFVQLDTSQLEDLDKIANKIKKVPPKPKPKPKVEPPKPKPVVKPAEKKPIPKKKKPKKSVQVASAKKRTPAKVSPKVSRHPKAGGGKGKGNTVNRNVNQAGILSMIGDSVSLQPQAAIAAVTNLDAVSSPNVGAGNYKVGGIAGKLGTSEISTPSSGIIATKGSTQVLRSAGAGGKGTVAALQKGDTGQKQVQGLVTANLSKAVRIQGGMSRAMVKRVIDQHLDEINYCYEVALISNPAIMGQMTFEWKILMSGRVGEIRIKSSSINSHEIHTCIKNAIKSWQFPKPKGSEVIVSYPFVFDVVGF
jgi:outer membrane biosynthesis protein TonB